ncbi:MAG: hypothetical protein BTN85_1229 [Candidatus Methanohalarchaeum thermophilum]|uniref:Uncharacterized protein n=1 Tax=Methanohalarchaeum thermophilum TaxID=1903181 RepID=A0A1Q6DWG6_METT1|nr:MAG: hypothetical protein BTN85_1229 [Candidatus Methanohalarchaeum thermophilum]
MNFFMINHFRNQFLPKEIEISDVSLENLENVKRRNMFFFGKTK